MLVLDGHKSAVYALAFSPDGDRLASGDRAGNVLLWASSGPQRVASADPPGAASVNAVMLTPDGRRLVIAWSAGVLETEFLDRSSDAGVDLSFLNGTGLVWVGNRYFAAGKGNRAKPEGGLFRLLSLTEDVRLPEFSAPQGVRSVSAAGERVAWSEWGRLAYVWDIRKPDRVKLPLPAEAPCVALAPDGATLAAGLDSYKVKLFDVARKQERRSLDGHTGRVTAVAFTPDGGTVASGSWDGTVRLWDAGPGGLRASYKWPVGKVTALAVSPDGLRLAVGGDGGVIVLADLD